MRVRSDEWYQGKNAFDNSRSSQENPYPKGTQENSDWDDGWWSRAERDRSRMTSSYSKRA